MIDCLKVPRVRSALLMVLALVVGADSQANIVINTTRVIYPEAEREVTVRLSNKGGVPSLVQLWIDDGRVNASPDEVNAPFTITPPIARVEPNGSQVVRLAFAGEPMASDRESVYWLNVLDVPPEAPARSEGVDGKPAIESKLQLAFRSRIKLFYRPKAVMAVIDPLKASSKLQWRQLRDERGVVLRVKNPTPFHLTIASVEMVQGDRRIVGESGDQGDQMLQPFGEMDFRLKEGAALSGTPGASRRIEVKTINDFGGITDNDFPLMEQ